MTTYAGLYGPEALIDSSGRAITSAVIDVFTHGTTTHVSLYQDNARGTPLSNPVPNGVDGSTAGRGLDAYGNLSFYVDPGRYDLRIATGAGTRIVEIEVETDPAESAASLPSQTGQSGKFLTTDGSAAAWGTVPVPARRVTVNPSGDTTGAADQTAVAAALSTLIAAGGGTLELGAGHFYWTSQQIDLYTVPAFLRIVGQGQATKVHSVATGTADTTKALFYAYGGADHQPYPTGTNLGAVGYNWIDISDMELIGNNSSMGVAISLFAAGRVGNIYAHGFTSTHLQYGAGIWISGVIDVEVENPICGANNIGLYIQGNSNLVIGGWLLNNAIGAYLDTCQGNTFYTTVFQGNTAQGCYVFKTGETRFHGCWAEANGEGAIVIFGISAGRSYANVIDSLVCSDNSGAIVIGSSVDDTTIIAPGGSGLSSAQIIITAGSTNTTLICPQGASTGKLDWLTNIQDGTLGKEFKILNGAPKTNTVAASGAALTLSSPMVYDRNVVTLTANCALTFPTAIKGRTLEVTFTQDATGSRTVTWPSNVAWPGGTAPTLTTTAGRSDRFKFTSDDGLIWFGRTLALNYSTAYSAGPLSVTGMLAWYDATTITGPDGQRLSSWPDISGNGRDLVQEDVRARKPTFYRTASAKLINSLPAVWWTGAESLVSLIVGSTVAQPTTIYIVCKPTALGAYLFDGQPRQAVFSGTNNWSAYGGLEIDAAGGSAAINTLYVMTAVFNGASSVLRTNGTQIASGNTGTDGFGQITLGARGGSLDVNFTGAICEMIVYSGAHSGATLTAMESYLTTKW